MAKSRSVAADQILADALVKITAAHTVIEGATVYVNSVPALIQAARDEVIANFPGITLAQLQPLTDLSTALESKVGELNTALLAGVPPPTPAPPSV